MRSSDFTRRRLQFGLQRDTEIPDLQWHFLISTEFLTKMINVGVETVNKLYLPEKKF